MSQKSPPEIPGAVSTFIVEHIDTVPLLEALLLLNRTRRRQWSADDLGKWLYVQPEVAAGLLAHLARKTLAIRHEDGTYQINLESSHLPAVEQTEELYRHNLSAITHLIHARPAPWLREFAKAFTFGGKSE